jgi:hypothetical protein
MAAKLLYDQDFVEWTKCAAKALREGRLEQPDLDLVAMEIEDMGKRDQRSVENNTKVLVHHLLKWQMQSAKRSTSWKLSIIEHRDRVNRLLEDSPSLQHHVSERLEPIYQRALHSAQAETGLESFPEHCPWTLDEILRTEFFPD